MSLRSKINDNVFSQRVNRSDIGKIFENSDFALSVEAGFCGTNNTVKALNWTNFEFLVYPILMPMVGAAVYTSLKLFKIINRDSYERGVSNMREYLVYS